MKKQLLGLGICAGLLSSLFGVGSQFDVSASTVTNDEVMEVSVDSSKSFSVSGYSSYFSQKFDMNKVFGDDHKYLTIGITGVASNATYKLIVQEDGKDVYVNSHTGPLTKKLGPYNDPSKSYQVIIQNTGSRAINGTITLNSSFN